MDPIGREHRIDDHPGEPVLGIAQFVGGRAHGRGEGRSVADRRIDQANPARDGGQPTDRRRDRRGFDGGAVEGTARGHDALSAGGVPGDAKGEIVGLRTRPDHVDRVEPRGQHLGQERRETLGLWSSERARHVDRPRRRPAAEFCTQGMVAC